MKKPFILITNDDGVASKGILALTQLAREFGEVAVIAPDKSCSGMSHAITMYHPLFATEVDLGQDYPVYSCNGTPVDCIKLALDELFLDRQPDLIISGINHGSNSNISVIYSGTMGAASEGAVCGITSIGLSLTDHSIDADFTPAVHYGRIVIDWVLGMEESVRQGMCLNVNVPDIPLQDIKGMRVCRQTRGCWHEKFVKRVDPQGRAYYWMSGEFYNDDPDKEQTDDWGLGNAYVTIVPVQMDLTDYARIDTLKSLLPGKE